MPLLRRRLSLSTAVTALTVAGLVWLGQQAGPGAVDLAAVKQDNNCSVTTGNGKVNPNPSANCPVDVELGNVLAGDGRHVTALAPGTVAWRPVDVANVGNTKFDGLTLETKPSASILNGSLRLTLRRCSVAWTTSSSGYSCRGTAVTLLQEGSATQRTFNLVNTPAAPKGGVDRLLVGITLVGAAPNGVQGASTAMTYTFTSRRN